MKAAIALMFALLTIEPRAYQTVYVETVIRETRVQSWQDALAVETPILDSLVDWEEWDKENDCLWELLKASGLEINVRNVMAIGEWADVNGGACAMIGDQE
jgi:hypothetical protein